MNVRLKNDRYKTALQRSQLSKRFLDLFLLAGLAYFFFLPDMNFYHSANWLKIIRCLKAFVDGQLATALLVFGIAYILTVALSLPIASLLTLAGGALLGWIGAAVIICAATIGATIVFIAASNGAE